MSVSPNTLKLLLASMTPEQFDKAVAIFEHDHLGYDVVPVNGPWDGGCDFKRFKKGEEQRVCVQVTVNKNNLKNKLFSDLAKVKNLISQYGYSSSVFFYCSEALTENTINYFHKEAKSQFGIELIIFEGNRLCTLPCPALHDYISSFLPNPDPSSKADNDIANSFLSKDICRYDPQFESKLYKESNLTVSDLFIPPIYSLSRLSIDGEEPLPLSNSVIDDCKRILQDSGLLLIKGPFGSGKTILTKALISRFRKDGLTVVCFKASQLKKEFFSDSRDGIEKCLQLYNELYIFIDSCEVLLTDSDFTKEVSQLLDVFGTKIHFIINYRSIQRNKDDQIIEDFICLQSPAVLNLSYFNNTSIQRWLEKFNNTRIASCQPVITYNDILIINKNLKTSCKNPLILYMVSSNDNAKKHVLNKNWYTVFHEFIKKTIRGKYESEMDLNPLFEKYRLNQGEYFEFLANVAGLINRGSNSVYLINQSTDDDYYLDNNEIRYSINASEIEHCVPDRITKGIGNRNTSWMIPEALVQTLNCYFFEVNETYCRFKDNNILFYFKAYNYSRALKEAVSIYDHGFGSYENCLKRLSSATSGMIIHPVEIEFILDFIRDSKIKGSQMKDEVCEMIYSLISNGFILNIQDKGRCKVDYEMIKIETLLCIIYMRFLKGDYSSDKMHYFFKRLSQYHSFAKLVDNDLSSVIQRYFCNITIAEAEFRRINLKNYNFNGSTLNNTSFIQCKLENSSIKDISCKDTTFDMCLISEIKDGNASVSGTILFKGCKLKNVTINVNKSVKGTKLVFKECVIDQMYIAPNPNESGIKVLTSFSDCIIRQCRIKVDSLFLSIQKVLSNSPIRIVSDYCKYYIDKSNAESGNLIRTDCKRLSEQFEEIKDFD